MITLTLLMLLNLFTFPLLLLLQLLELFFPQLELELVFESPPVSFAATTVISFTVDGKSC